MSAERASSNQSESIAPLVDTERLDDLVYLFRGVHGGHARDRIGKWWSEDPYYVDSWIANNPSSEMFVAVVSRSQLVELSSDRVRQRLAQAKQEGKWNNVHFLDLADPPVLRLVTTEELAELWSVSGVDRREDSASWGGVDVQAVAKAVFASKMS